MTAAAGRAPDPARDAAAFAEAHRERLVRLCADLVAARSDQPEGDTTAPAAVLSAFLEERGLRPERRARDPRKPNVVCRLDGAGPGPHLILNGHLDTLPPGDEAGWTVPVFALRREAGRLSGLGIGNMKAGVAALALAFAFLAERADRFAGRVTLTAVADEVVFGPDGAAWLLDTDPDLVGNAVLNGEGPGFMDVAPAEKGLLWVEVLAEAPPGQGMLTKRGSSAAARLAAVLGEIDGWNDETATPPAGLEAIRAGEHGLRLSANAGTLRGGSFVSQVATEARAEVDFRVPPGLTVAGIERRLDALAARSPGLSWRRLKGWDPNWTALDHPLVRAVTEAAAIVRGERGGPMPVELMSVEPMPVEPAPVVRLPASDAARWRARGVPAVCFGPQATLASGVDDAVDEQDVVDCAAIYALAALGVLGGGA